MIDWSKSCNGVMLCTINQTLDYMPEMESVIQSVLPHLQYEPEKYRVDVKVHMLMPGEYPCIPNWHCDFIPRDENLKHIPEKITPDDMMYIYVSGEPKTEFKTYQDRFVEDEFEWTVINQRDLHRGMKSEIHTWRCFTRLIPEWFIHPTTINIGTIRRHSQVYIDDPQLFGW